MPGDVNYAREKYHAARDILAEHPGAMRERLVDSYSSQACRVIPIQLGGGPEISVNLCDRIQDFDARMTSVPPKHSEGMIQATVDAMADVDVSLAVEELLAIASLLDREYHDAQHR